MKKNLALLLEHYPELDDRRLMSYSKNTEHDILIYDNQRIFKFPNQAVFARRLKKEIHFINFIRPYTSFELPAYDILKKHFASYKMIKGQSLRQMLADQRTHDVPNRILKSLAEFLQELHAIPFYEEDKLPEAYLQKELRDWQKLIEEAEQIIYPEAPFAMQQWIIDLRQWFEKHSDELEKWAFKKCLIHGDLSTHHIILNKRQTDIKGIVDFGFAGVGDPAIDIAAVLSQLGADNYKKMLSYYPDMESHQFRAKLWTLSTPLWWAIKGIKNSDRSWFFAGLATAKSVSLD